MSFNLLGKIASAHVAELRKTAAPMPRPASKPMAPVAKPAPAAAKPTHHIYDNKGMPLRKNPAKPQQTQEEWVPHWKGDIGTGP